MAERPGSMARVSRRSRGIGRITFIRFGIACRRGRTFHLRCGRSESRRRTEARGSWGFRRSRQTAAPASTPSECLIVTHPFHPLLGRQLPILFARRQALGRLYICEGGALGTVTLPEEFTDRGLPPASRPLTVEV